MGNQLIGGVAQLAHLQEVKAGVVGRVPADRGPSGHGHLAGPVGPLSDLGHALALGVHARDHDHIHQLPVLVREGSDVFVLKTHLPGPGQIGGHGEDSLGGHEGDVVAKELPGVVKGGEAGIEAGEDAEHPAVVDRLGAGVLE